VEVEVDVDVAQMNFNERVFNPQRLSNTLTKYSEIDIYLLNKKSITLYKI